MKHFIFPIFAFAMATSAPAMADTSAATEPRRSVKAKTAAAGGGTPVKTTLARAKVSVTRGLSVRFRNGAARVKSSRVFQQVTNRRGVPMVEFQ